MKEYTITKTLFKMRKKKHILPSVSREGENYVKESLGQFALGTDMRDGPNDFCQASSDAKQSDGNFPVLSPVV